MSNYPDLKRLDPNGTSNSYYQANFIKFKNFMANDRLAPFPPDLYIPLPQEKVIPGIVYDEQILGKGQALAMRLYDASNQKFRDLHLKDLRNNINIYLDQYKNILISCASGSIYESMPIWSMIFNIYDASGWLLKAQKDVSLNLVKTINTNNQNRNITNNTQYGISFENISQILRLRESELSQSSRVDILNSDIDRDYLIYIENGNELKIKTVNNNVEYNGWYIDALNINIYDISFANTFLKPQDVFLYLDKFAYDICYNTTHFSININQLIPENTLRINNLIRLDPSGSLIGILKPSGYNIHNDLEYFNINNLTFHYENLITLETKPIILGNILL